MMLKGKRPAECEYCWRIEDAPGKQISDRVIKSSDDWSLPFLDSVARAPAEQDFNPSYVELSFSHVCNFKCSYCLPHISSSWMEEIKQFGPYQLDYPYHNLEELKKSGKLPLPKEDENPYVEAFWKWWPSLSKDLKVLRVTGGEPLLSPSTFRLLDQIIAEPLPNLELAINSNLGIPDVLRDQFIRKYQRISKEDSVKKLSLYTSIDSWGKSAEYIRHGLQLEKFWANVEKMLVGIPNLNLTFMCTFNLLSVPKFDELLEKILELKKRHLSSKDDFRILIDISYLMNPAHQSVLLYPKEDLQKKLNACSAFIEKNIGNATTGLVGFIEYEQIKFNRLKDYVLTKELPDRVLQKKNFYRFFREHDRRRGTSFIENFPELAEFWLECQNLDSRSQEI